jgi:hypothetical protein
VIELKKNKIEINKSIKSNKILDGKHYQCTRPGGRKNVRD